MDALTELLIAQDGRDVRRLHPGLGVWHLARPGLLARSRGPRIARLEACRREVLRGIFAPESDVFILHPDPPTDYDVPGRWGPVADQTWLVPDASALEGAAAAAWLALGCWVVYAAAHAVTEPWPDMFRLPPGKTDRWITAHRVGAAICSLHDDDEWRVVLRA
jgi:hypothetical protein